MMAPTYIFPPNSPSGVPCAVRFAGCIEASDQEDLVRKVRRLLAYGEVAMSYPVDELSLHIEEEAVFA